MKGISRRTLFVAGAGWLAFSNLLSLGWKRDGKERFMPWNTNLLLITPFQGKDSKPKRCTAKLPNPT